MPRESTVIHMYTATTGDGAASIDVPDDGHLMSVAMLIEGVLNADAEKVQASIEFGSVPTRATNDSRSLIAMVMAKLGLLTSGAGSNIGQSKFDYGPDGLQVFGGERIYLHTEATGGTMSACHGILIFSFVKFVARRR